jgi:hypothetical protein
LPHAIAPVALGLVKRLVGRAKQRVNSGHADGRLGRRDAHGDPELHLVGVENMAGHALAQPFRHDHGLRQIGSGSSITNSSPPIRPTTRLPYLCPSRQRRKSL